MYVCVFVCACVQVCVSIPEYACEDNVEQMCIGPTTTTIVTNLTIIELTM